jgi:2'-5' RNA ligase
MPFAITLRLDLNSATTIEAMWRNLATNGIDDDRARLGYSPHITFAICEDNTPVDVLREAVGRIARCWDALPVTLAGLGIFPGSSSSIWAAPVVTAEMLARQSALRAALQGIEVHSHYRSGHWVPHITLSGALRDPGRAVTALATRWQPFRGSLDRLDLLHFRPVEVLESHALGSPV